MKIWTVAENVLHHRLNLQQAIKVVIIGRGKALTDSQKEIILELSRELVPDKDISSPIGTLKNR